MRERDKYECYGKGDPGQRSGGEISTRVEKGTNQCSTGTSSEAGVYHTPAIIDEEGQW